MSSVHPGKLLEPGHNEPGGERRGRFGDVDHGRGPRIGLVLGAGGAAGAAYHAGALLAVERDIGWDPRTADLMVGTSIGSIVALLLRAGMSTDDLAAWASGVEPQPDGLAVRTLIESISINPLKLSVPRLGGLLAGVRQAIPSRRWLHRPSMATLSALLPHGIIDASEALAQLCGIQADWTAEPLWIPAVRTRDGRRVVFGRDERPPLGAAVGASCAIPMLLRPVRVGNHHYIDGATHSPTNADLLLDAGVDVAVVLSPMSGRPDALGRRPDHRLRAAFARRLRAEAQQLVDAGIDVHTFEPDTPSLNALAINPLDRTRIARVVPHAFLATRAQIDSSLSTVLRATTSSTHLRPAGDQDEPADRDPSLSGLSARPSRVARAHRLAQRRTGEQTPEAAPTFADARKL